MGWFVVSPVPIAGHVPGWLSYESFQDSEGPVDVLMGFTREEATKEGLIGGARTGSITGPIGAAYR